MLRRCVAVLLPVPLVMVGVATIVFLGLRVIPGDAVGVLGSQGSITAEERQKIASQLGLESPIYTQYAKFIESTFQFDFGLSYYSRTSVASQIGSALPATIELAVASVLVMSLFGVAGGFLAAAKRGTWVDSGARGFATAVFSVPWFSLGIILIIVFSVKLHWLPPIGRMPSSAHYEPVTHFVLLDAIIQGRFSLIVPWLNHLILPAITVGLTTGGFVLRVTRASILEVAHREFVITARAKGMSENRVLFRHIARNASIPIVTTVGLLIGGLLGGVVVTEVVFAYPGVGQLLVQSIIQRDYPVAQGAAIVVAFMFVIVNTLTDLTLVLLDPRIGATAHDG